MGFFPALAAFLQGIQDTPGLREILWDLIEKPSVWSIVKNRGRVDLTMNFDGKGVAALERPSWVPAGSALYHLSPTLALNNQPALHCWLFVTAPRPPLLTTAGIVGIVASPPSSNDKRLDIRILAAHRAASTEASPAAR